MRSLKESKEVNDMYNKLVKDVEARLAYFDDSKNKKEREERGKQYQDARMRLAKFKAIHKIKK